MPRKCPSTLGLVVDERLHANGDKWFGAVVVLPVDVGVGCNVSVYIGMAEQEELPFSLWNNSAPQVDRERRGRAAEDAGKMVLPCLDCPFSYVAPVVIWRH